MQERGELIRKWKACAFETAVYGMEVGYSRVDPRAKLPCDLLNLLDAN